MLVVKQADMVRAFRVHARYIAGNHRPHVGQPHSPSSRLLMFYAVECGVKALLMRRHQMLTTKELCGQYAIGHDINAGLRRLGAAVDCRIPKDIRSRDHGAVVEARRCHEAWRYGKKLHEDDERDAEESLRKAINWLDQQIAKEYEAV